MESPPDTTFTFNSDIFSLEPWKTGSIELVSVAFELKTQLEIWKEWQYVIGSDSSILDDYFDKKVSFQLFK